MVKGGTIVTGSHGTFRGFSVPALGPWTFKGIFGPKIFRNWQLLVSRLQK